MSRLHKKCLIASVAMHSLLLGMLVISPALVPATHEPDLPVLTLIPTKVTDDPSYGGGSPKGGAPAVTPPSPTQPPRAEIIPPREPDPIQPEPPRKTEPKKATPKSVPKPMLEKSAKQKTPSEKPSKKTPDIVPSFTKSADNSKTIAAAKAKAKAQAEADARARARYLESLDRRLNTGLSTGTEINIPFGPGGEAYANYNQVVISIYQNAWLPPGELSDDSATVKAEVVILRDGKVKSARIVKPSGISALDASVDEALKLKFVRPFPDEAKDSERAFSLNFNPEIRRRF